MRAAKAGPDYIDPAFHAAATGAPGVNLDSWAMAPPLLDMLAHEASRASEILIIEGVMGLFDGVAGPPGRRGSTADLAARFRLPVLLVLDVSGQLQTAAAVARGIAELRSGGARGRRRAQPGRQRAPSRTRRRRHGGVRNCRCSARCRATRRSRIPERHLGLVQAGEHADLAARLDRLADMAERHLDIDAILAEAAPVAMGGAATMPALPPPGQRVALARDRAFSFIYPHVLDGWRGSGAEIVAFSPLADEPPPPDCDSCWLPGGYPELHAGALAAARRFQDGLARFAATRPVHGECGGYMVLGEVMEDADGTHHAMTGLLGHATSFAARKLHLGYREARLLAAGALGPAGAAIRGHEFHYASLISRRQRRAVVRSHRRSGGRARRVRRPARPRHRRVLPRDRAGVAKWRE